MSTTIATVLVLLLASRLRPVRRVLGTARRAATLLAVIAALGALATLAEPARPTPRPGGTDVVDRVVDGDTVRLRTAGTVRLIGVDTPEAVKPRSPVECYGPEASAATRRLLPAGTAVRLVYDVERRDRYGRTLAYLYRAGDGLFVNADLIRTGHATTLTIRPNTARAAELAALERQARRAGRGLWSSCRRGR